MALAAQLILWIVFCAAHRVFPLALLGQRQLRLAVRTAGALVLPLQASKAKSEEQVKDQQAPFLRALIETARTIDASGHRYFFPGHQGGLHAPGRLVRSLSESPLSLDLPELDETDNVHSPEVILALPRPRPRSKLCQGPLLESLQQAAKVFGAKRTWYLVNGSTGGIHLAMLALAKAFRVQRGELPHFLLGADSHKSVFGGLELCQSGAVVVPPMVEPSFGVSLGPSLKAWLDALATHGPLLAGVVLTRPSYQGLMLSTPDLCRLADACRTARVPLLVDEAHGGHLSLLHLERQGGALGCGADVVVQSAHKGLSALTQTALLHLGPCSTLCANLLNEYYSLLTSTSPSALLLASLDATQAFMGSDEGRARTAESVVAAMELKRALQSDARLRLLEDSPIVAAAGLVMDPLKLSLQPRGGDALALDERICTEDGILCELNAPHCLTFALGAQCSASTLASLRRSLLRRCGELAQAASDTSALAAHWEDAETAILPPPDWWDGYPEAAVCIAEAEGATCAETISVYPPGTPLVLRGQTLTAPRLRALHDLAHMLQIGNLAGRTVTGARDASLATLRVFGVAPRT